MAPPEMKDLANELHPVSAKWKSIGRQLNVSEGSLDSIANVHGNNPTEALAQMLRECLKRSDPELSWADIVEALKMPSIRYCKKFG